MKTMEVNRAAVPQPTGVNGTSASYEKKKGEPVYDAKLVQGVNRIEVEVIAEKDSKGKSVVGGTANAATAVGTGSGNTDDLVDVEKCTVFVHLMKGT